MHELALFAGAGGGILGGLLLGWKTVCAVERDAYAAQVLAQRQNDGILRPFPIWSDVRSFDGKPWRGIVDVISGGFPCQDISAAGRGAGIGGEKSGLWFEMARIIDEVRPSFVLVENSPRIRKKGLNHVISNLAEMGYDSEWFCLSASSVGAPHKRDRAWIIAYTSSGRHWAQKEQVCARWKTTFICDWWKAEPGICRVDDGLANRVDRIKALGNGQVPRVAATAFSMLNKS